MNIIKAELKDCFGRRHIILSTRKITMIYKKRCFSGLVVVLVKFWPQWLRKGAFWSCSFFRSGFCQSDGHWKACLVLGSKSDTDSDAGSSFLTQCLYKMYIRTSIKPNHGVYVRCVSYGHQTTYPEIYTTHLFWSSGVVILTYVVTYTPTYVKHIECLYTFACFFYKNVENSFCIRF